MRELRIAVRDWDYLTPLLLGEVDLTPLERAGYSLQVERVSPLVPYGGSGYDGFEVSMSQYWRRRAAGDDRVTALPHVMMRGFRHRCVMVSQSSPATRAQELLGGRIGLTGWPDSGNTWTRAALAAEGLSIDSVTWVAGRLTAQHPIEERLHGFGVPGRIEVDARQRPLVDLLEAGELDAVLTPFMPSGFFSVESPWRPLFPDLQAAESAWFQRSGFVPGMHVLGFDARRWDPEMAALVGAALTQSEQIWQAKRQRYADTTPWLFEAMLDAVALGAWNRQGLAANREMFDEFGRQLVAQGILPQAPEVGDLFPTDVEEYA